MQKHLATMTGARFFTLMSSLKFLPLILFFLSASALSAQTQEYIIASGGPALRKWEEFRMPDEQHDRWWGNFIRPARMRIEEIKQKDPQAFITWLVYRGAFVSRSAEDKRSLTELVESVRDKFHVHLVWINGGTDVINYLNSGQARDQMPICNFEYFGHSNRYCFMFDYSNEVYAASSAWLHESELFKINRGIFTRDAFCKSWGCHTGEHMSKAWRKATGVPMWGAYGKTDYSQPLKVQITDGGHWTKG